MTGPPDATNPPRPRLAARDPEGHKGDYGRALLVGGSRGMTGAIALAGMAALRGGAGLVTLAVPEVCLETVAAVEPSYMTSPLPADQQGRMTAAAKVAIEQLIAPATCVACGPGVGRTSSVAELVGWMYETVRQPLVLDADALTVLASRSGGLGGRGGPRVLTPHPGEFRRLAHDESLSVEACHNRAIALAAEHGVIMVLKGHRTLVTDGRLSYRNTTGNPGMATGGSGDVLTGVITALVCQGLAPREAAQLGVYVHGLAGDLAAQQLGQVALVASDLVRYLPDAFQRIAAA